jgi:gliding motility-associated-like protein
VVPPPTTTQVNQSFCELENATVADIEASGNNIVWYDTETSTTALDPTETLVDGQDYWATQSETTSGGCQSDSRLVVTVTIIVVPPPSNIMNTQDFCISDNPTVASLTPNAPFVVWYDTETSTTALDPTETLINGQDYWASQFDNGSGCQSLGRIQSTVSVDLQNAGEDNSYNVCETDATINNLFDLLGMTANINGTWSGPSTLTGGYLGTYDPATNTQGDYSYTITSTSGNCPDDTSIVSVTITSVAPATIINTSQQFCETDQPSVSNLEVSGNGIVWFDTINSIDPLDPEEILIDGEDYWAAQTDSTSGCTSSTRVQTQVGVTTIDDPLLSPLGNEFCLIKNPTLTDLDSNVTPSSGGSITWYDSYPNGSQLNLTESLIEGATYYAVESDANGCTNINPLAVTVGLQSCDAYEIEFYDGFSPTGNGINDTFTITNLKVLYPDYKVEFFNRWGNKVYTADSNRQDWNGQLNGDGELVPSGVYYFVIYFNKDNRKPIQNRLYLSR